MPPTRGLVGSSQGSDQVEYDAGERAGRERRDHSGLEAEDRHGGCNAERKRPWIDTGPNPRIGCTARKIEWMANQIARLRMTPTTAAVIADNAALSALFPRSCSTKGAPRKIHRKHGVNVTQVASRPPRVPAASGESPPGSRNAAMKPTNWSTMISGPGVVSAIPRPSSISPGCSQP